MGRLSLCINILIALVAFAAPGAKPATNTANHVVDATTSVRSTASNPNASEVEVKRLLAAFVAAMPKSDVGALDKIWADDFTFVSHDGEILTKAQLLELLKSGTEKFESIVLEPITIRIYGRTAVVTAKATQKATLEGKDHSGTSVVSIVLVKSKGRWQMVLAQLAELKAIGTTHESNEHH